MLWRQNMAPSFGTKEIPMRTKGRCLLGKRSKPSYLGDYTSQSWLTIGSRKFQGIAPAI